MEEKVAKNTIKAMKKAADEMIAEAQKTMPERTTVVKIAQIPSKNVYKSAYYACPKCGRRADEMHFEALPMPTGNEIPQAELKCVCYKCVLGWSEKYNLQYAGTKLKDETTKMVVCTVVRVDDSADSADDSAKSKTDGSNENSAKKYKRDLKDSTDESAEKSTHAGTDGSTDSSIEKSTFIAEKSTTPAVGYLFMDDMLWPFTREFD